MLVKVGWQRPFWCADELVSIFVLVDVVFCVEKTFNSRDRDGDRDPVLSSTELKVFDAVCSQPVLNKRRSFVCGLDEIVHLLIAQMLAISCMIRVRYYSMSEILIDNDVVNTFI